MASEFDRITETITRRLGPAASDVIADLKREHAGATVYVPANTRQDREQRNQQIRQERSGSTSVDRIASRNRISQRQAYRLTQR
jgi:Mor family transcriptional regulator